MRNGRILPRKTEVRGDVADRERRARRRALIVQRAHALGLVVGAERLERTFDVERFARDVERREARGPIWAPGAEL